MISGNALTLTKPCCTALVRCFDKQTFEKTRREFWKLELVHSKISLRHIYSSSSPQESLNAAQILACRIDPRIAALSEGLVQELRIAAQWQQIQKEENCIPLFRVLQAAEEIRADKQQLVRTGGKMYYDACLRHQIRSYYETFSKEHPVPEPYHPLVRCAVAAIVFGLGFFAAKKIVG